MKALFEDTDIMDNESSDEENEVEQSQERGEPSMVEPSQANEVVTPVSWSNVKPHHGQGIVQSSVDASGELPTSVTGSCSNEPVQVQVLEQPPAVEHGEADGIASGSNSEISQHQQVVQSSMVEPLAVNSIPPSVLESNSEPAQMPQLEQASPFNRNEADGPTRSASDSNFEIHKRPEMEHP